MKKLLSALVISLLATSANAKIDQEKFDKDTAYYNTHKDDAKAITILLSPFNTDNSLKKASDLYNQGKPNEWAKLEDRLRNAIQKAENIGYSNYMSHCTVATEQALLMWKFATYMTSNNFGEWDTPEAANLKMYKKAKQDFEVEFLECKRVSNNPPDRQNYE